MQTKGIAHYLRTLAPCIPPRYLQSGHLQTMVGHLWPTPALPAAPALEKIKTDDGGILIAEAVYHPDANSTAILFHGLGGSTQSGYMRRIGRDLYNAGLNVVLVNHRGVGPGKGLAQGPYHSGRGEDVSAAVAWARQHPILLQQKIIVIGFSLGGNMVLNLATGQRGHVLPDAAIAVNPPCDLSAAQQALQRGLSKLYDLRFVYECRRHIAELARRGELPEAPKLPLTANLGDVDEVYTARYGGFMSAQDYYARCSTHTKFQDIRVPTTIMTAKDDPFIPWEPFLGAQGNPFVHLRIETHGGHLGYIARGDETNRWIDRAVVGIVMGMLTDTQSVMETLRLSLRPLNRGDVNDVLELNNDLDVMRYIGEEFTDQNTALEVLAKTEVLNRNLNYRCGMLAAIDRSTNEFVGWFMLRPHKEHPTDTSALEIGFRLKKKFWNQGLATEGVQALINMAKTELATKRFFADVMQGNIASLKVLAKMAFLPESVYEEETASGGRVAFTRLTSS